MNGIVKTTGAYSGNMEKLRRGEVAQVRHNPDMNPHFLEGIDEGDLVWVNDLHAHPFNEPISAKMSHNGMWVRVKRRELDIGDVLVVLTLESVEEAT